MISFHSFPISETNTSLASLVTLGEININIYIYSLLFGLLTLMLNLSPGFSYMGHAINITISELGQDLWESHYTVCVSFVLVKLCFHSFSLYRSRRKLLSMDKVTYSFETASRLEEFIARVFHNGLALGWKPFSINWLMLLIVSSGARQKASGQRLWEV